METAQTGDEGSVSRSEMIITGKDFSFQNTYAKEMLVFLCVLTFTYPVQVWVFWNKAQHFVLCSECIFIQNKGCKEFFVKHLPNLNLHAHYQKFKTVWNDQIEL